MVRDDPNTRHYAIVHHLLSGFNNSHDKDSQGNDNIERDDGAGIHHDPHAMAGLILGALGAGIRDKDVQLIRDLDGAVFETVPEMQAFVLNAEPLPLPLPSTSRSQSSGKDKAQGILTSPSTLFQSFLHSASSSPLSSTKALTEALAHAETQLSHCQEDKRRQADKIFELHDRIAQAAAGRQRLLEAAAPRTQAMEARIKDLEERVSFQARIINTHHETSPAAGEEGSRARLQEEQTHHNRLLQERLDNSEAVVRKIQAELRAERLAALQIKTVSQLQDYITQTAGQDCLSKLGKQPLKSEIYKLALSVFDEHNALPEGEENQ